MKENIETPFQWKRFRYHCLAPPASPTPCPECNPFIHPTSLKERSASTTEHSIELRNLSGRPGFMLLLASELPCRQPLVYAWGSVEVAVEVSSRRSLRFDTGKKCQLVDFGKTELWLEVILKKGFSFHNSQ